MADMGQRLPEFLDQVEAQARRVVGIELQADAGGAPRQYRAATSKELKDSPGRRPGSRARSRRRRPSGAAYRPRDPDSLRMREDIPRGPPRPAQVPPEHARASPPTPRRIRPLVRVALGKGHEIGPSGDPRMLRRDDGTLISATRMRSRRPPSPAPRAARVGSLNLHSVEAMRPCGLEALEQRQFPEQRADIGRDGQHTAHGGLSS